MKKLLIILVSLLSFITMSAEDRFHINVLNEISYQQAKSYPKQWEISTSTYVNPQGVRTTKYFIFAPKIKHDSSIVIEKAKKSPYPWRVSINGLSYFANFDNENEIRVGDSGVLKYEGDRLYFYRR